MAKHDAPIPYRPPCGVRAGVDVPAEPRRMPPSPQPPPPAPADADLPTAPDDDGNIHLVTP